MKRKRDRSSLAAKSSETAAGKGSPRERRRLAAGRAIAGTLFAALLVSIGWAGVRCGLNDARRPSAPPGDGIIPREVMRDIREVQSRAGRGSSILYFLDFPGIGQAWQLGLVNRLLFPGNLVIPVYCTGAGTGSRNCECRPDREPLPAGNASWLEWRLRRHRPRYAIAAVPLPAGFEFAWQIPLAAHGGTPLAFGELRF